MTISCVVVHSNRCLDMHGTGIEAKPAAWTRHLDPRPVTKMNGDLQRASGSRRRPPSGQARSLRFVGKVIDALEQCQQLGALGLTGVGESLRPATPEFVREPAR